MTTKLKILTIDQREKILQQYELTSSDIRVLERRGINKSREIIKEIQKEFPQYEYNGLTVYSYCYKEWKKKKAPSESA